jgi:hypothetical protein
VGLKTLVRSPEWASFRAFLEGYAELRAQRLLGSLSPEQTNLERGAIAAVFEIASLPEQVITQWEEYYARRKAANDPTDDTANFYWKWGNALFADDFRKGRSE